MQAVRRVPERLGGRWRVCHRESAGCSIEPPGPHSFTEYIQYILLGKKGLFCSILCARGSAEILHGCLDTYIRCACLGK
jgi:hypothetical protein